MGQQNQPYRSFGEVLKKLRAKAFKTPAEVSSAVEIEESKLRAYENGEIRPTEDILLLLIQHFNLTSTQAEELWKLAGYTGEPDNDRYSLQDDIAILPQLTLGIAPADNRIVYTDMIQVMVNNYGVIMNFMQGAGTGNQPIAAAKVGMSKEHARSVIEILQKTLDQAEQQQQPRQLSSGTKKNDDKKKS